MGIPLNNHNNYYHLISKQIPSASIADHMTRAINLAVYIASLIVATALTMAEVEPEASGASVVMAVVSRIQTVFGDDNQFLRRIAYVESRDGTHPDTYRSGYHGGIWQVDEIGFKDTQDTRSHRRLLDKYKKITVEFGINWPEVQWRDLRKPLYSGIAARLFLSNIPSPIPLDIAGQGNYWADLYNKAGAGTQQKFIDDVKGLD